jgi:tartrate dehydratase alpha subunit/fumarate hydratase class I-like protein
MTLIKSTTLDSVPAKLPRIVIYLPEDVKADLEKLANVERRSVSSMGLVAIEEAIKRAKAEGRIQPTRQDKKTRQ